MKKLLVVIIALMLTCAGAYAGGNPDFTKTYDNTKGVVTFNHTTHSSTLPDCFVCHEGEPETIAVDKGYAHITCKSCHKVMEGPKTCTGCHVK